MPKSIRKHSRRRRRSRSRRHRRSRSRSRSITIPIFNPYLNQLGFETPSYLFQFGVLHPQIPTAKHSKVQVRDIINENIENYLGGDVQGKKLVVDALQSLPNDDLNAIIQTINNKTESDSQLITYIKTKIPQLFNADTLKYGALLIAAISVGWLVYSNIPQINNNVDVISRDLILALQKINNMPKEIINVPQLITKIKAGTTVCNDSVNTIVSSATTSIKNLTSLFTDKLITVLRQNYPDASTIVTDTYNSLKSLILASLIVIPSTVICLRKNKRTEITTRPQQAEQETQTPPENAIEPPPAYSATRQLIMDEILPDYRPSAPPLDESESL